MSTHEGRNKRVNNRLATMGFTLAVAVAPVIAGTVGATDPPKVEFIAVEGRQCLQPIVSDARPVTPQPSQR